MTRVIVKKFPGSMVHSHNTIALNLELEKTVAIKTANNMVYASEHSRRPVLF
jgi:hypothetical protein